MFRKIFNKIIVSDGVKGIGKQMIDNPLDWVQGNYEFVSKSNPDITIWTCNGIKNIKIRGFGGLSYSEKAYLNNCIKMSIANRLLTSVKTKQ